VTPTLDGLPEQHERLKFVLTQLYVKTPRESVLKSVLEIVLEIVSNILNQLASTFMQAAQAGCETRSLHR